MTIDHPEGLGEFLMNMPICDCASFTGPQAGSLQASEGTIAANSRLEDHSAAYSRRVFHTGRWAAEHRESVLKNPGGLW